jgi:hypothetical protein
MVQIGTEAGLLPAPVMIPNQPVDYEYNRRNIVVLNVNTHALWLGPAERADVIIDFSSCTNGSTIILYNDAPAPAPAFDPRYDYYTGNPDYSATGYAQGGTPTTIPGFGPNLRTFLQFRVSGTPTAPFDLTQLATNLPVAFAASQPPLIVPAGVYARIADTNLTFFTGGGVSNIVVVNPGSRFTSVPAVAIVGGGGAGATAHATISGGAISSIVVDSTGSGYTSSPTVQITGGGGRGALAKANGIVMNLLPKCIQELFDTTYGRMNALLGVELPFTTALIQTTIPYYSIDPPTEVINDALLTQ